MSIYDRWGIQQNNESSWRQFINRLLILIGDGENLIEVTRVSRQLIAYRLGTTMEDVGYESGNGKNFIEIESLINVTKSPFETARNLEVAIDLVSDKRQEMIKDLVNRSKCGFRLAKSEDNWVTFPEGEKFLDKKAVEEPLSFLNGKPAELFGKALEDYSNNKSVEAAEKTRRTLEEYFRQFFNSSKLGLDEGIRRYGKKLKDDNAPEHIRLFVIKQLNHLNSHYNDSSKHQSETKPYEAEYLIYSVGTILRFIDSIKIYTSKQSKAD